METLTDVPKGFSRTALYRRVRETVRHGLQQMSTEQCSSEISEFDTTVLSQSVDVVDSARYSDDMFDLNDSAHTESEDWIMDLDSSVDDYDVVGTDAPDCRISNQCIGSDYNGASLSSDSESSDSDSSGDDDSPDANDANSSVSLNILIAEWAIHNNITTSAIRGLLAILKPLHPELPRDPRTLLRTPTSYTFKKMVDNDGQYYHFGISSGLQHVNYPVSGTIKLQFNFDGLPLFKSSTTELWPILCLVTGVRSKPFVVGIYSGKKKPKKLDEFLYDFVEDLRMLLFHGIVLDNVQRTIEVHCFVCDAPARAYIKNVKLYSGYSGCEKCEQEGEYIAGKVTFPLTSARLRTDDSFRQMTDDEHHHGPSPLTSLGFGMVTGFVLDYMHLVCQGVMRRLINFWLKGPVHKDPKHASRLSAVTVARLSEKLINIADFVPREFARKPRTVAELDRWKATEFRQFLLYTGPVVLRGILTDDVFNHFMQLSVGITLLCSLRFCHNNVQNDYAHALLVSFVEQASSLYGPGFMVYNVHCLSHLAADGRIFGSLDNISAFPFENHLKQLKSSVRKRSLPLPQIVRRISEKHAFCNTNTKASCDENSIIAKGEHYDGPVPDEYVGAQQFSQLFTRNCFISLCAKDGCVAVEKSCKPSLVRNILLLHDTYCLVCEELMSPSDLFLEPLPSSCLGIYKVSSLCGHLNVFPVTESIVKYVYLPLSLQQSQCKGNPINLESGEPTQPMGNFAVIPLVHQS